MPAVAYCIKRNEYLADVVNFRDVVKTGVRAGDKFPVWVCSSYRELCDIEGDLEYFMFGVTADSVLLQEGFADGVLLRAAEHLGECVGACAAFEVVEDLVFGVYSALPACFIVVQA